MFLFHFNFHIEAGGFSLLVNFNGITVMKEKNTKMNKAKKAKPC